jgi:diaminopimelate epimerase
MHGAGNDFIFIDKNQNKELHIDSGRIRKLCDRRFGIGGDGLITIEDIKNFSYKMGYYNADGSTGSLCANGARCSIWFAEKSSRLKNGFAKFISNDVEYSGVVISDELIKFNLNLLNNIQLNLKLDMLNGNINYSFIDTGSPHVVIKIKDLLNSSIDKQEAYQTISDLHVYDLGKKIRFANELNPGGSNVNFINIKDDVIEIRTYERGVENETLACGTGSVAAAVVGYLTENLNPPITLLTRGGDKLIVDFQVENHQIKNINLTGPAKIVFEGSIDEKFFI